MFSTKIPFEKINVYPKLSRKKNKQLKMLWLKLPNKIKWKIEKMKTLNLTWNGKETRSTKEKVGYGECKLALKG